MGEEVRDGQVVPYTHSSDSTSLHRYHSPEKTLQSRDREEYAWATRHQHPIHDPLGLLHWRESLRTKGWITLQVVGSFGVMGGVVFWVLKTWGGGWTGGGGGLGGVGEWARGVWGEWFGGGE
jgi:hypothetical protein